MLHGLQVAAVECSGYEIVRYVNHTCASDFSALAHHENAQQMLGKRCVVVSYAASFPERTFIIYTQI